ncbi:MAG: RpiB/LacA/LacB family sugar-phosphate isomerase [Candidatus Paceibacterota bacterium]|jgi:ribose 5-phosphate isomerase B
MNKEKQTIILASDHAGFKVKEAVKSFLQEKSYTVEDVGAYEYKEGDDYPEYMVKAAMKVAEDMDGNVKAIIFGMSGEGEAIVANRFPGVRAVVWYGGNDEVIKLSREHNDANVLSIGAHFVSEEEAKNAVIKWLETPFSDDERHKRRIMAIDSIE